MCDGDEYTMNEVDLSIVTVVYNGEEYLEQTIQSVLNQCSMGIEYILVDGGSTDGTMSIVNKYIDQIDVVVSEEDCGIYDAMNKGLEISSKRYIYFLNSNDFFSSHDVLRNIDFKSDVIMANTCGIGDDGVVKTYFRTSYSTMDSLEKMLVYGDTCSHQGIFIKKKNHKKFIEELKLDADRVVIASNIHSAKSIQLINRDIVFARLGGASSNNYRMIFDKFIIPRYVKDIDRLRYYFYFLLVASKKIAREFLLAIGLWRVK